MILFRDIIPDLKEVTGVCDVDYLARKTTAGVELLTNKGPWGRLIGAVDICTQNCDITLPRDVDVPEAININGRPADFRNKWFQFHLNGPGTQDCGTACYKSWEECGFFPTFRELISPSRIVAIPSMDEGLTKSLWIYGYDENGQELWTECGGVLKEGMPVPIIYGAGAGTPGEKKVSRITRIYKPDTVGLVDVIAQDFASWGGVLIGRYAPDEQWPSYRRIRIQPGAFAGIDWMNNCCQTWVRMKFKMKQPDIRKETDVIMIHSKQAIVRSVQAVEKLDKNLQDEGMEYLGIALGFLRDRENSDAGPNTYQFQFQGHGFAGQGVRNR